MNTSMCRIAVTTITLLILTACSPLDFGSPKSDNHVNYREVGERATLESITGVWEEFEYNSDDNLDLSYVVIRSNGTYMSAVYNGEPLPNGEVGCYSIVETTIERSSEEGVFIIEGDSFQLTEIFTYENTMGFYVNDLQFGLLGSGSEFVDSEYERSTNTEAEFNFTPICQS